MYLEIREAHTSGYGKPPKGLGQSQLPGKRESLSLKVGEVGRRMVDNINVDKYEEMKRKEIEKGKRKKIDKETDRTMR